MLRKAERKQYRRVGRVRNSLGCVLEQLGLVPGSATSFSRDLGKVS